jgi:hypothetical protein
MAGLRDAPVDPYVVPEASLHGRGSSPPHRVAHPGDCTGLGTTILPAAMGLGRVCHRLVTTESTKDHGGARRFPGAAAWQPNWRHRRFARSATLPFSVTLRGSSCSPWFESAGAASTAGQPSAPPSIPRTRTSPHNPGDDSGKIRIVRLPSSPGLSRC